MLNLLVALSYFPKITPLRYAKLLAYFKNSKDLWESEIVDLVPAGLPSEVAHEFLKWRDEVNLEKIETDLEKEKIKTVCLDESDYPDLLKEIPDAPITIFYRGEKPKYEIPSIAVVGTRKCSQYGERVCEDLVRALTQQKIIIISGLAFGIDGTAHETCLKNHGHTIAVLGSGVNDSHIMPRNHLDMAKRIIENGGTVLSEYPPGTTPTNYTFPARNRIIAGLSLGTLVIEAPAKSGALITAHCALDYNREVMAIPHPVYSQLGAGNNNLLKMGATLITTADDILNTLDLDVLRLKTDNLEKNLNSNQAKILAILSQEPQNIDNIIKITGLASSIIGSELIILEMTGVIKRLNGNNYAKIS